MSASRIFQIFRDTFHHQEAFLGVFAILVPGCKLHSSDEQFAPGG